MQADLTKLVGPLLVAAFVVFALYRRVRRSLGRQVLRSAATLVRAVLLVVVCGALLLSPLMTARDLAYIVFGALLGLALAAYALRHTKFEVTDKGIFYTGHPYIGLAVIMLLIGRIIYRVVQVYPTISQTRATAPRPYGGAGPDPFSSFFGSPTTLAAYFLMAAYYVLYGVGLLATARRLRAGQELR